jgi:hypothetical protein
VSFYVFLQCFDRGEPAGIPRSEVRSYFPIVEAESDSDLWSVRYDSQNHCEISVHPLESDPNLLASLSVSRPCGDVRLWDALLATMQLGNVMLYFTGVSPPLVATVEAGTHIPPDMVEHMGQGPPRVVTSSQQILDAIRDG